MVHYSKERSFRVCVELTVPSPLAALLIAVTRSSSDDLTTLILGFPILVLASYAFGIWPSVLYAFLMEIWFGKNLHFRLGLLATTVFSGILGAAAGFAIQIFPVQDAGFTYFITIGGIVGLIIGFFLCRYSRRESNPR